MKLIDYMRFGHTGARLPTKTLERNKNINKGHGEVFFKAFDDEFNLRPL